MKKQEQAELLLKARHAGGAFCVPSPLLIRVSGKDCLRYLNGQLTNDLRKLTPGTSQPACLLTPKGRLIALLQVTMEEDAFLIETDASLKEIVLDRLERYLVADDVTIEIITPPETVHLFGNLIQHAEVEAAQGVIRSRLGFPGKDLSLSLFSSLSLSHQMTLLSTDLIEVLRIEQKIPRWGFELTPETLPPEARLEETAIDYNKGCYLGQEIISRLKSVGHVNRLLYGFISEEEIMNGMEIFSEQEPTRRLGVLTSVGIQYDTQRWIALGYLQRGREQENTLFAKDPKTDFHQKIFLNTNSSTDS